MSLVELSVGNYRVSWSGGERVFPYDHFRSYDEMPDFCVPQDVARADAIACAEWVYETTWEKPKVVHTMVEDVSF